MPNPVSIIVWRDARTDPPKGQLRGVLVEFENGKVWTAFANTLPCEGSPWDGYDDVRRWAELPVLSELTDEDVRRVVDLADGMRQSMLRAPRHFNEQVEEERDARIRSDQEAVAHVRAALGGEKEEA